MKFSENKALAAGIAAAVVVASTLLSGGLGLQKACDTAENAFFVSGGKAPYYYVNQSISAAASLAAVGSHYEELSTETAALRLARSQLTKAYEDRDIEDMAEASGALLSAADGFAAKAGTLVLTAEDRSTFEDASDTVYGAERQLLKGDYNTGAESFIREVYDRFPASLFAALFDVDAPELYLPGGAADD